MQCTARPGALKTNAQPVSGSYVTNATTMYNLITATGPANLMNAYQTKVGQFTPMPFYTVLCQDATILNKPWFVANPTVAMGLGEGVYTSAPREEASAFFGGYLPGTWLGSHSNLEERLNIVYNNNRGLFMDSYLTTIGVNALNSALHSIPQLTIGAYLQSVYQGVLIGTLNPTYQPPDVNTPDPSNITADTLYLAEHHLYGSSRLGIKTYDKGQYRAIYSGTLPAGIRDSSLNLQRVWYSGGFADWIKKDKTVPYNGTVFNISLDTFREVRRLGSKQYEMTDHLGNVLATVQDRKSGYGSASGSYVGFNANVTSLVDYYPFGFQMSSRVKQNNWYRDGFNGKEKDDEVYGGGNFQDFGERMHDTRTLRLNWSIDPLTRQFPWQSPYIFAGNNPIRYIDKEGLYQTDKETAKNYPVLQIVIESYLPLLIENQEVKAAFLKNLGDKMTEKQFNEMVSSGTGLTIEVTDGVSQQAKLGAIQITTNLLDNAQQALEKARKTGDGTDLMTQVFELTLSILHESSHEKAQQFGLVDVDKNPNIERGFTFEERLFGERSTTSYSKHTTMTYRDHDKVRNVAIKNYGTRKLFGLTISGQLDNFYARSKFKIPMSTNLSPSKKK